MPIVTRSQRKPYPGAVVEFWNVTVTDCPSFVTTDALLKELQKEASPGEGCSMVRGKCYTSASLSEIAALCNPP